MLTTQEAKDLYYIMSASGKGGCKVYFGGLTEATGITTEESFRALLIKEDVTPQWYTYINLHLML